MRLVGQINPIIVRRVDGRTVLVAGLHRLEAAKLNDVNITCFVVDCDDVEARLAEIAENLHRADLTVQERSNHVAEWIRLTEAKAAEISGQVGPKLKTENNPKGAGRAEGGINAAARELGIDRKEAQRALKVASITPEAREAAREANRATSLCR